LDVEYFILLNFFIFYIVDKITIKYTDPLKPYESVKKMQEFIKNIQKTYKENNKEITYLTSLRDLNSSIVEQAKIDENNDRKFKLKAIINFSLVPKK
ncbi:MSC_0621 family F1-like ATPase epsilon subunit, partial [Mycoplasmopsis synoviae]|uniref:MSC_0621 family F1-like ATPase epsilon subunit n=1 Tax=Mycoplasmopsis synoviae TaxID=2109 RepID=UPI00387B804F